MADQGDMICARALPEQLQPLQPVTLKSTLTEPAVIMKEPDPLEAFVLALHERVVELETFATATEKRMPELPPTGFNIRHSERGWIFGVTIWEEGWPRESGRLLQAGAAVAWGDQRQGGRPQGMDHPVLVCP